MYPLTVRTTMTVCPVGQSSCPRKFDSITRQQLNSLQKSDNNGVGKRRTIHSGLDGQICTDHDKSFQKSVGGQASICHLDATSLRIRSNVDVFDARHDTVGLAANVRLLYIPL